MNEKEKKENQRKKTNIIKKYLNHTVVLEVDAAATSNGVGRGFIAEALSEEFVSATNDEEGVDGGACFGNVAADEISAAASVTGFFLAADESSSSTHDGLVT